jgi:GNAT superfamily N-acetyltransferase
MYIRLANPKDPAVRPSTAEEDEQVVQLFGRAFLDDPAIVALLKENEPEKRRQRMMFYFRASLAACKQFGRLLFLQSEAEGIAGAALVYPPGAYPPPVGKQFALFASTIRGAGISGLHRWAWWMVQANRGHSIHQAHYYLELIGIDPLRQGQGLGALILTEIVASADRERVGCFLETSNPRNVPIYQHFGFEIRSEGKPLGVPTYYMWRPAVDQPLR